MRPKAYAYRIAMPYRAVNGKPFPFIITVWGCDHHLTGGYKIAYANSKPQARHLAIAARYAFCKKDPVIRWNKYLFKHKLYKRRSKY